MDVEVHRLIDEPRALGKLSADHLLQPRARRRRCCAPAGSQALAARSACALRDSPLSKSSASGCVTTLPRLLEAHGPVRVIQVENRGLGEAVRRAVAVRVQRVALDLGGAALVGFGHQRDGPAAASAWPSRNTAARRARSPPACLLKGRDFPPADGTRCPQPEPASRNEADMIFTKCRRVDRVGQLAGPCGKFPFHPLPKLRRVRQLVQAPPVASGRKLPASRARRVEVLSWLVHRWQAEQFWRDSTCQSCMSFLAEFTLRSALAAGCRPFPVQIGNLVQRAQLGLRMAMAIQAEGHAQRLHLDRPRPSC